MKKKDKKKIDLKLMLLVKAVDDLNGRVAELEKPKNLHGHDVMIVEMEDIWALYNLHHTPNRVQPNILKNFLEKYPPVR